MRQLVTITASGDHSEAIYVGNTLHIGLGELSGAIYDSQLSPTVTRKQAPTRAHRVLTRGAQWGSGGAQ